MTRRPQASDADLLLRLQEARVPPCAASTTLERLRQPMLRAVVTDRQWRHLGNPVSFCVRSSVVADDTAFLVESRLAAELCIRGCQLLYVSCLTLDRELARYRTGATQDDALHPALTFGGHLFVTGFRPVVGTEAGERVADYLMDRVSSGRPTILCLDASLAAFNSSTEMRLFTYCNSLPTYPVQEVGANV